VAETVGQLKAAEATAKALSDAASAQSAQPLKANTAQTNFINAIDPAKDGIFKGEVGGQPAQKAQPGSRDLSDPTERFAKPFIVSEAPGDIGLTSPASSLVFAGQQLHVTAQQDAHLAAAHTISVVAGEGASWFSHSGGIKAIAAAGSNTIQAHTDAMSVLADQSVTVTSSNDEIHILANSRIVLQAGQSSVTLAGGDITFACPGTFSVKGCGNAFVGPGSGTASLEGLPTSLTQVSIPQTPIETVYSQALDFSETPDAWLPDTLGESVQSRASSELLADQGRTADAPVTDGLLTKSATNVDYWAGSSSVWNVEEATLQPDDISNDANESRSDDA
jgi:type VI secretion system secreted protein VgrG